MLAQKELPQNYLTWNRKHGAPWGHAPWFWRRVARFLPSSLGLYFSGPFSIQPNNSTRIFEYPWAFYVTPITQGLRVLDIGGGLGGFQFILDRAGCSVFNLDPGLEARGRGWRCDQASISQLNGTFGTSVELQNMTMEEAHFEDDSFDRIYSISVIEHIPDNERRTLMTKAYRCLKKGGYFILTVDLFLGLTPFTAIPSSSWGTNADIKAMVEAAPFRMVVGNPAELIGFPEFHPEQVQAHLDDYFNGQGALSQCLVLQK